ncbi:D-alanyl-D-alanine carboxypeptidase [Aerococcaceae bacterium NML201209]|nr:D-alanyl-D-alanine carboxypeptidase [Aerococcaceae bacterium NML201209]
MKLLKKLMAAWLMLSMGLHHTSSVYAQAEPPATSAKSAMIISGENGQILYEHEAKVQVELSDVTKLLSVYLVYQAIDEGKLKSDTQVLISDKAYAVSQDYDIPNVPLRQDFDYTVEELLEAVGVTGANGAMIALAEKVAGSEEKFVELMHAQLQEWHIDEVQLLNATGLTDKYSPTDVDSIAKGKQNRLSGEAVAKIAYHLYQDYPDYLQYTKQRKQRFKDKTDDPFDMTNPNTFLESYEAVDGWHIGYSHKDGASMVATTNKNNMRTIAVVLGTDKPETRYQEAKKLLDYVYAAYSRQTIVRQGDAVTQIGQISVANGASMYAPIQYAETLHLVVPLTDTTPRYDYTFMPNATEFNEARQLIAPVQQDTTIGSIQVNVKDYPMKFLDDARANHVNVKVSEPIEEAAWYTQFWRHTSSAVSQAWEATRKFFTDLFN